MEIYDYTVEKEESGIRIDRYLAEKDSSVSLSGERGYILYRKYHFI